MYSYQDYDDNASDSSSFPPMPAEEPSQLQQFLARMGSGADRLQSPSLLDAQPGDARLFQPGGQDLNGPPAPALQGGPFPALPSSSLTALPPQEPRPAAQDLRMVDFQKQQMLGAQPPAAPQAQTGGAGVRMVDAQGNITTVPRANVREARQSGRMVTPDNGVRMITPDGQITYALPEEVDQFRASGHVPLKDNGYFQVDPLPGEAPTETMARAARIAKNLPPEVLQKAIAAEEKTFTKKRLAATLGGAAAMGVAGPAALAAAGEVLAPAEVTAVGTGLYDAAGNEIMREVVRYGPRILQRIAASPYTKEVLKGLVSGSAGAVMKELFDRWRGKK